MFVSETKWFHNDKIVSFTFGEDSSDYFLCGELDMKKEYEDLYVEGVSYSVYMHI